MSTATTAPNIVFILADDLGYADLRCFHRSFIRWTGVAPGQWRAQR